jgi:hypothetical protein
MVKSAGQGAKMGISMVDLAICNHRRIQVKKALAQVTDFYGH